MKKIYLIKNQEVFQGSKYLKKKKNYFEGWYFKNVSDNLNISFIPGISLDKRKKKAFVQIITKNESFYVEYDIKDFIFCLKPFYIKIKDNYFSFDKLKLNIVTDDLKIVGELSYEDNVKIKSNWLSPNIMGPFTYISFMECNHAIINMKNKISGRLVINNEIYKINNGIGYIEKDWGVSFPKRYVWCQANYFNKENASFMLSIADIPFKVFSFEGFICVLIIDGVEYRFTSYNGAKIVSKILSDDSIDVILKKGKYILKVKANMENGKVLVAPVKGKMDKNIVESIDSFTKVTLFSDNNILFEDISYDGGLEIVR